MELSIKDIWVTLTIIGICVLVFFATSLGQKDFSERDIFNCIQKTAPSCLRVATTEDSERCFVNATPADRDLCIYNLDTQCVYSHPAAAPCLSSGSFLEDALSFSEHTTKSVWSLFTVITYMFVHANVEHLIGNMIALFLAGVYVEKRLGKIKYLLLYLISGIISAIVFITYNPDSSLVGASGAIFGLFAANLVLRYFKAHGLYDHPLLSQRYLIIIFIAQIYSLASDPHGPVAYLGHIAGFAAGVALAFLFHPKEVSYIDERNLIQ